MSSLKKAMHLLGTAFATLLIAYAALAGYAVLHHGYSWTEMDWNQDGTTSIKEIHEASDIGKREINRDGRHCAEYFSFKDGMPVKTLC